MHQVCGDAFVISQRLMLPEDLSLQVWQESLMYREKRGGNRATYRKIVHVGGVEQ